MRVIALSALWIVLAACTSLPRRPAPPPGPGDATGAIAHAEPHSGRAHRGNPPFYDVNGRRYTVLASADHYVERGVASWYGRDFQGHNTSSGERYDMYGMTAAHKTLPLPCYARVTNLANGRSIVVRINDRGPFVANRIVDLSYTAATQLDLVRNGTAFVELRTVGPAAVADATPGVAATPPILVAPPTAAMPLALYIQVGAYSEQDNAQRVIDRLRTAGVSQVLSVPSTTGGRTLRRVRVGPIATVEEFDRLAVRLAGLGYGEARLATD